MAFLATDKGSINESFIVKLETKKDKVKVLYLYGTEVFAAYAEPDDARAFMDKVNGR